MLGSSSTDGPKIRKDLDVGIDIGKTVFATTHLLVYFGLYLMQISLPEDKLLIGKELLKPWFEGQCKTKRELLSLIWFVQHCQAIETGRPFLGRLTDKASAITNLNHFVQPSSWEKDDVKWWFEHLSLWNGKCLLHFPSNQENFDIEISSDATGALVGATIWGKWFAQQWPASTLDTDISIKEFIPLVIAATLWGKIGLGNGGKLVLETGQNFIR